MNDSAIRKGPAKYELNPGIRYSKDYFLPNGFPVLENLLKRTDALTGLSNVTAEELQVTYYDAGGWHTAHYDAYLVSFLLVLDYRLKEP